MSPVAVLIVAATLVLGAIVGFLLGRRPGASSARAVQPASVRPPADALEPAGSASLPGALAEAVDQFEHGVVVVDGSGGEVYRNPAAHRLGTARDSRTLVESALRRLLVEARTEGARREDVELFGPPAQLFVLSALPFHTEDGTGALGLVEDRSGARRVETVRRDFVANISHELKTPVGALGLLAETIRDETDPEVTARLAKRMTLESERVARTIDDLLELSRIEFGDETHFEDIDVRAIVDEAVARIGTAAEQAGEGFEVQVGTGIVVHGDRAQLVSAVFNLLDNAVKYSGGGGRIRVKAVRDPSTGVVALSVQDEGIGIPRRSLERIFERFYRVDRARSRNTGGTGLGLAIVRHVVSNHGGQVLAESVEGEGSTFTLIVPCAPRVATDSDEVAPGCAGAAPEISGSPPEVTPA